nr:unnamed protein product [Digitaria exilis]
MDVDTSSDEERRPSEKEHFSAAESGDASAFASLTPADLSLRNEDSRSLLHVVAAAAGHPQARKEDFHSLESNRLRWCSCSWKLVVTPRMAARS